MTSTDPITRLARASFKWNMAKGKRRSMKPEARAAIWAELIYAARAVGHLDPVEDLPPLVGES